MLAPYPRPLSAGPAQCPAGGPERADGTSLGVGRFPVSSWRSRALRRNERVRPYTNVSVAEGSDGRPNLMIGRQTRRISVGISSGWQVRRHHRITVPHGARSIHLDNSTEEQRCQLSNTMGSFAAIRCSPAEELAEYLSAGGPVGNRTQESLVAYHTRAGRPRSRSARTVRRHSGWSRPRHVSNIALPDSVEAYAGLGPVTPHGAGVPRASLLGMALPHLSGFTPA